MQFSLRTKLLISFIAIALLVIVIFGFTAYRVILNANLNAEFDKLLYAHEHEVNNLLDETAGDTTISELRSFITGYGDPDHLLILVDADGLYALSQPLGKFLGPAYQGNAVLPMEELRTNAKMKGTFSLGDRTLIWVATGSSSNAYKLFLVSSLREEFTSFTEIVGSRLLVTGVSIIWVSIWGALILASITSKRLDEKNALLLYQALHDDLTGLPNRALLYKRLNQALLKAAMNNKSIALFVLDLDRFKDVNDTLGHSSGDLLLQQVGNRMQQILRHTDTVARLGGDEFALLIPYVDRETAMLFADRITRVFREPFRIEGMQLDTEASLGISLYPDHGKDADTLIKRADIAMYQAKRSDRSYAVYDPEIDSHSMWRLSLLSDLRHAINADRELELYYQPKVNLRSGRTESVEALLRWHHPRHGTIQPDEFIFLAEQSGLIRPLTLWVLNAALRQCHEWRKEGIHLDVAVNLAARNVQDEKLAVQIGQLLDAWGIPPGCLILEITEHTIMADPHHAEKILHHLEEMGVQISIDDFGTGYSSMALLSQLPVHEIKIDKSFVTNMLKNKKHLIIVRSIVDLANSLGCSVTAEGVEDHETLEQLTRLGCVMAQGFNMSHPLSPEDLERWLAGSIWRQRPVGNVIPLV